MACSIEKVDLICLPPADEILSQREANFFQTLRLPKRRMEWLGGRFALKRLIHSLTGAPLQEIEALPHPSGKPILTVRGEACPFAFSITHSHGWAAACVSRDERFVGIDLEKIEKRSSAWAESFFHPSERKQTDETFLTALWTQKEALVKLLGTGLSVNSYDVRCIDGQPFFFGAAQQAYMRLGSPRVLLQTYELVPGMMFTLAHGQ